MNWHILNTEAQWQEILQQSAIKPQLVYKHSTRCSISSVIKSRLERAGAPADIDFYYLDLIAHRAISNQIADEMNVPHESPQVLLIKSGVCVYNESHGAITMDEIIAEAKLG
ncbi:MAG: bacillithiol system redox-active protein YtxJ [Chitinophagaceae bacterium]|nr:bacillithiol system redox-active protein YtxJ [Chitinophagaceae bacterium]